MVVVGVHVHVHVHVIVIVIFILILILEESVPSVHPAEIKCSVSRGLWIVHQGSCIKSPCASRFIGRHPSTCSHPNTLFEGEKRHKKAKPWRIKVRPKVRSTE